MISPDLICNMAAVKRPILCAFLIADYLPHISADRLLEDVTVEKQFLKPLLKSRLIFYILQFYQPQRHAETTSDHMLI